ncbi:IS4 family transposase [candidate division KSB1 bacterium]|nr:IS4 family transposase [candidate division KSB1 bacterium]
MAPFLKIWYIGLDTDTKLRNHPMRFKLQVPQASMHFTEQVNIPALSKIISSRRIDRVLEQTGKREKRCRKVSAAFCIWFCIALNLFTDDPYQHVLSKLVKGLRYIWSDPNITLPGKSALCAARSRLGVKPIVALFQQTAKPLADFGTPGAFLFGLRLMAIDGSTELLADTPENVASFGRHTTGRGTSAFPQAQVVYLSECCTHAIVDAGIWPLHTSERVGGLRLLRSLEPGMLVLIDRGFFSYTMAHSIVYERGAHFLARVGAQVTLPVERFSCRPRGKKRPFFPSPV